MFTYGPYMASFDFLWVPMTSYGYLWPQYGFLWLPMTLTFTTRCSAPRAPIGTGPTRANPSGSTAGPSFSEPSCQIDRGAGNCRKPYRLRQRVARLLVVRF